MTSRHTPPIADLSLDLDNQWSYMKTHGDEEWRGLPSYLNEVIPHFLGALEKHRMKITVMVVGQDAALEKNQDALRMIDAAGHEIGNHSFHHEPWLQKYSPEDLHNELAQAEEAIANITDQKLVGFRGPGYCLSPDILDWLIDHGYQYDGSTFPTYLGPLARAYYFFRSSLSKSEQEDRSELFGSISDGFRRLKPYRWETSRGSIVEIPVTTMPIFRVPFHFSYLHYLAQYSQLVAILYFRCALLLCRATRTAPSMLMHPLDFLGGDDVQELAFFPAMNLPGKRKRQFMDRLLGILGRQYSIVPMRQRAEGLVANVSARMPVKPASQLN